MDEVAEADDDIDVVCLKVAYGLADTVQGGTRIAFFVSGGIGVMDVGDEADLERAGVGGGHDNNLRIGSERAPAPGPGAGNGWVFAVFIHEQQVSPEARGEQATVVEVHGFGGVEGDQPHRFGQRVA